MITEDINDLIYIAERQSDERLAQELNPETETGMLGPPWLSASELAYRQKIRSEAQAEPSTAPSIVQQLAQISLPQLSQNNISSVPSAPIGMPQQPMPQQPMPQQPMPQQPMPQQPMPQQQAMPTQMMYSGGLVGGLSSELMDFQNTNVWSKFPSSSGLGLMSQAYEDESLMGLLPMLYKQRQSEKEKEEEKENSIPMMAGGGSVKDALSPDFSSVASLMQGLGGGLGVSDEGTAEWWNPIAALPHVQYANLVASGEPLIGLPLGNIGNITADVTEFGGIYEPPSKDYFNWDEDENNPFKNRKKMSAGGLLNYANGGRVDSDWKDIGRKMLLKQIINSQLPLNIKQVGEDRYRLIDYSKDIGDSRFNLTSDLKDGKIQANLGYRIGDIPITNNTNFRLDSNIDKEGRATGRAAMRWQPNKQTFVDFGTDLDSRGPETYGVKFRHNFSQGGIADIDRKKMSAGGLLNYANGGIVNDPYAFNLQSPSFAPFPMDAIAPMPKEEFEAQYGLGTLDYDPADSLRFSPPPLEGTYQKLLPHIEEKIMGRATETVPEEYSPFRYGVTKTAKELLGYGTAEESQREIDARKINLGLRDALREIEVEGSAGFGDITGYFRGSKKDHKKITEAEDFFEGLMPHARPTGSSFWQKTWGGEADTLTISRFFANNPDEYAKLNYLTEKFGPKRGLVQYSQANKGLIDRLNKGAEEVAEFYGTKDAWVADTPTTPTTPTTPPTQSVTDKKDIGFQQSTVTGSSAGVESDIGTGLIDTSIENIVKDMTDPKGKMQDKWLAIAAGAFNAAQKGSPTLMQGLADLGGGIIGQLQNLKKEDRLKAEQLFDLYKTRATYQASLASTYSTSGLAFQKHVETKAQNLASNVNNYEQRLAKAKELGDEETARLELAVQFANHGVPAAQLDYRQGITDIRAKEIEIEQEVRKDLGLELDQDLTKEATDKMTEGMMDWIKDNAAMGRLYQDYYSRRTDEDKKYFLTWQDNILTWSPKSKEWVN